MSNSKIQDILDILDYLELDETRKRLAELYKSPEFSSYNSLQLLREKSQFANSRWLLIFCLSKVI